MSKPRETGIPVPASRLARAGRMARMGTGILGAVALGGARTLAAGRRPDPRDLLLTPGNVRRLTDELSRMRGAAMKMGQLLSMESGDILPPDLSQILARLRAEAEIMPPKQLKTVLIEAYGGDFLKRFRHFDTRPVAAASIGQVHRATTRDGRDLALKIQYPGIRGAIDADVSNLGTLIRMSGLMPAGVALSPLLQEARRQLHEEADYRREAQELAAFGALAKDNPDLLVPRPHEDFSTDTILAMDFIESVPIETVERADQATRDGVATRLFELFLRELFDWRRVQTDPNFANYRWQADTQRIVLLDFGASRGFDRAFADRFRKMTAIALAGDGNGVRRALSGLDILPAALTDAQSALIDEMIALGIAELSRPVIDFADPGFLAAMRDRGMALGGEAAFRHIPPWDVLYLQRKLGGLVLLATRLRARVPLRAMLEPRLPDQSSAA